MIVCIRDIYRDKGRLLQNLSTMMTSELIDSIQHICPPWLWMWQPLIAKTTLELGRNQYEVNLAPQNPSKINHFIWLCLHNALPTKCRQHHRNMVVSPSNTWRSPPMEDLLHYLCWCPHSIEVWIHLGMVIQPNFFFLPEPDSCIHDMIHNNLRCIFIAGLWKVWCWHNNMLFENHPAAA